MPRASFLRRLYVGYVALIVLTTAITGLLLARRIEESSLQEIRNSLDTATAVMAEWSRPYLLEADAPAGARGGELAARLRTVSRGRETRFTVILPEGRVLADSHEDPAVMDNHAGRAEVRAALESGLGESTRESATLGLRMMYLARAVYDRDTSGARTLGAVRAAIPLDTVDRRLEALRDSILLSTVAALALALLIGFFLARRWTRPLRDIIASAEAISRGENDTPIAVRSHDEFGTLARAFNAMRERVRQHNDTILGDRNKIYAILSAMTEGVIAVDQDEEVLHMNSAAARAFLLDPAETIGRPLPQQIQNQDLLRAIERTLAGNEGRHGELRLQLGMQTVFLDLHTSVLHDSEGHAAGAVVVLHDITDVRRLEEVRSDFVSNVSHELKTPLAAIKGLVESILEDAAMPEDTRQRFLRRVGRQADRLNTLVVDLLSLSRIEREETYYEDNVAVDLRAPLRDAIDTHREAAERHGVRLDTDIVDRTVRVVADHEGIRQIVDNLLSNAIRYTPEGGEVTVRLKVVEDEAVLEVEDTGVGIDPSQHERIFERFYRVDKARSRELGGTGLGLSIVKHLLRRIGASISVDSELGRGSRFTIEIPLASDRRDF